MSNLHTFSAVHQLLSWPYGFFFEPYTRRQVMQRVPNVHDCICNFIKRICMLSRYRTVVNILYPCNKLPHNLLGWCRNFSENSTKLSPNKLVCFINMPHSLLNYSKRTLNVAIMSLLLKYVFCFKSDLILHKVSLIPYFQGRSQ